ncbi:MAG: CRISPR-associated endonuclease Cas3'', partial [Thermodesulfobacteriota bacterium]
MTEKFPEFMAHSPSLTGRQDPLSSHLTDVARLAEEFAMAFNAGSEARLVGLAHDLGKFGDLFQRRLRGLERGVDHWSAGAWAMLSCYRELGVAAALVVQGHHLGLRQSGPALKDLDIEKLRKAHPLGLRLSPESLGTILERFNKDGLIWPDKHEIGPSTYTGVKGPHASAMLDVRMLFSALVDADFIETEAHFQADAAGEKLYRPFGPFLNSAACLEVLLQHISALAEQSEASATVNSLRQDLLNACLAAADLPPGLFTLTAPTGAGKTLSMLAFALKHASIHKLRRIVTVIPYLTIIEQTARVYRQALA